LSHYPFVAICDKTFGRILIRLDVFVIAGIPNNRIKNAQSHFHIFFGWITQYRQLKENREKKIN
jgi:hypothetical protein